MNVMKVRDHKKFIKNIPDDFNNLDIWYVDFVFTDALKLYTDDGQVVIEENDEPPYLSHTYTLKGKKLKETQV